MRTHQSLLWILIVAVLYASWPMSAQAQVQPTAPIVVPSATSKSKVRVIIALKNPLGFEHDGMQTREIASRRAQVARDVRVYVQRNITLLKVVHRELTILPMVVATVASADLPRLATAPDVTAIYEDTLHAPDLAESTDLIHSRATNEGGNGGTGQLVAVLDTGVDRFHEFLNGQVVVEACFSSNNADDNATSLCPGNTEYETGPGKAIPCTGISGCDHGTHVAGIVAGKRVCIDCGTASQVMMSGVAPDAKIAAVQVFSKFENKNGVNPCSNSSTCVLSYSSDQVAALQWLMAYKAGWQQNLVSINMSLGGGKTNAFCDADAVQTDSINQLRLLDVATVIAAGNSAAPSGVFSNGIASPGCISSAITIGSTFTRTATGSSPPSSYNLTVTDTISSFSQTATVAANGPNGNGDRLLDLLAPGSNIYASTSNTTDGYVTKSGTSMATPHVAGAWAVIKGVKPNLTVSEVLTYLRTTGRFITDARNGLVLPRINVGNAVTEVRNTNLATQVSTYGLNFGRVTRNQTVYLSVGIQTSLNMSQPLSTSMTGDGAFFLHSSSCLANLYYRPTCVLTIGFTPTSAQKLQIYTGRLDITTTIYGFPTVYKVGLYGRSEPTTPDTGQTQTVVAMSRTSTRTQTLIPTIALPVWTVLVGATRTIQQANLIRTGIALNTTQFVLNDRLTATAERVAGSPTRTRSASVTRTPTSTPVPILRTINVAQTRTRDKNDQATATRKMMLTQTAGAIISDRMTATQERTLGLATRTKIPPTATVTRTSSVTRSITGTRTTTSTATPSASITSTATPMVLTESTSVALSNQIQRIIPLPNESAYAVLTQGTSVITPALALFDSSLTSLAQIELPGEKASALTHVPERPGLLYVGGRLFKDAMYIQSYEVVAQTPVVRGLRLELGNGEPTAMYATDERLYVAFRFVPQAGGAERFEVRAYDISEPRDIVPIPGLVAVLSGPVNDLVGVPLSNNLMIAVGKRANVTSGFVSSLYVKPTLLQVASTVLWPREVVSAVARSTVTLLQPQHTLFMLDRQDIVALSVANGTGAIAAQPLNKVARVGDAVALDPTHAQLLVGRYNATVPTNIETSLHVYDILPPAGLRLRGATNAVTGDGVVRGIAADFGQIIMAAGMSFSRLGGYGLLAPTLTPSETLTPSMTKTASRTSTETRTVTSTITVTLSPTSQPSKNRIEAGNNHTCVIDFLDVVKCWGDAAYGQLGNNATTPQPLLVAVNTVAFTGVRQIDSGWNHTCARNTDNTMACWGENPYGELADEGTADLLLPQLSSVVSHTLQVAVGWHHACAINTARAVLCWGMGTAGQLGNGLGASSNLPQVVFGVMDARQITLGATHACAVTGAGWLYCWGGNSFGQLGTGETTNRLNAQGIISNVIKVATYENTTCVIYGAAKYVFCVGDNQYGQAGTAPSANQMAFTAVITSTGAALANIVDIEVGMNHICALDSAGLMYCWGDNFYGQSGSSLSSPNRAVLVAGLSGSGAPKVVDMALGENHTCALLANNTVKCWGRNDYGQLGDGTTTDSSIPVLVFGLNSMLPTPTP